jgi:uncharacterized membrane protein
VDVVDKKFEAELLISWSLKLGVYSAAGVVIVGLVMFYSTGISGYPADVFPTNLAQVYSGVLALKAAAITSLGLLLLIFTPVFRVIASVFVFVLEADYIYTAITLFVLAILLFSFFFGKAL